MIISVPSYTWSVSADTAEFVQKTTFYYVADSPSVPIAGNYLKKSNNILSSSTRDDSLHWHRQVRSCKNICKRTEGATPGVGSAGYNKSGKKRCVKCEMFFVAEKKYGEREFCVCCGSQLRDRPRSKNRNQAYRMIGD